MCRLYAALPALPILGGEFLGLARPAFDLRRLHYEAHQMGLVEETEKYDGAQSYGLGRRDRLCLGGRLLSQSIFLSELCHPFFFFGEDDAHGRLSFSK